MNEPARIVAPRAGGRGLPLVGHLPAFLADRLAFLDRSAANGAAAVELRLGERTLLLLDWRDVRHVLVQNASHYEKTWRLTGARGRRVSGAGVLTRVGEAHLAQRRLLQPLFHARVAAGFAQGAVDSAVEATSAWEDGAERAVRADMLAIARTSVLRLLFGRSFRDEGERLAWAIETRRRYFGFWFFSLFPWPELLPVQPNRDHREALRRIDEAIGEAVVAERGSPTGSLLSLFLEARYADGTPMSDEMIRDEVRTLMVTGHETVGEALTWTWIQLSRHPEIAARLRDELDEVLGDRDATAADLPRLPYAAMVVAESLRLRPPTWLFVRIARRDDLLPSGVRVRAGVKLYLCPWVVQRSPRYFPAPERFDPERFRARAQGGPTPPGWFPFGAGPRVCLGEAFARLELVLILAAVARRFRLELLPGEDVSPFPGITLHPRGEARMRITRRTGEEPPCRRHPS
jgi:cytochrome P450